MNLHLPQSVQTENELIQLASVPTQIISPKDSSPIISIVQDVCLGVYRLTKDHIRVTEKQLFNLLANNSRFVGQVPKPLQDEEGVKKWSGKQVLSTIMPPTVNLRLGNNLYDPDKNNGDKGNFVVIENGEIKQGVFDKKIYQNTTSGLIHTVFNECGPDETRKLFDNTQRLICDWLVLSGFSVGVSDLIVDSTTSADMKKVINEMKGKAYDIIRSVHNKTFENKTIQSNAEAFEDQLNKLLNEAREKVSKVALKEIQDDNRMINMIRSKSKGNSVNVAQMIAALGQQNVEGKRIAYGFDDRTLPHFTRFDDGPEARGFVENSFIKGLSPQEFFFHAMGGREGLIDTAVKTSSVGYIQRKLVKAMEDCKINYDLTVRNAGGNIVQFLYGEDGMSSTKLEAQIFTHIEADLAKLEDEFLLSPKDDLSYVVEDGVKEEFLAQDGYDKCREFFHQVMEDREYLITKVFNGKFEKRLFYPISFMRIVRNAESTFHTDKIRVPSDLSPLYVMATIETLASELKMTENNAGNKLLGILLRCNLSPKQMVVRHRFNKMAFDWIVQQVRLKFYESIAHPSEMVGVVAAQSIGEPSTQLTLNSVDWHTEMLLDVRGKIQRTKIGEFIDANLEINKRIEHHEHDTVLGWTQEDNIKVLSCDESGNISWKLVEAVTRHPPINEDGSPTLLKVTTESGREVIATKAKSFLKRVDNKIVQVRGDSIKVGDYLPYNPKLQLADSTITSSWDVSKYLAKNEYIFMSEVQKGKDAFAQKQRFNSPWFKQGDFVVPYARSDSFVEAFGLGINEPKRQYDDRDGCVYPVTSGMHQSAHIPEHIPLDELFGFFVGAYLAEGCCTEHHILISNVDDDYNQRIHKFCQQYGIKYHVDERHVNNGYSKTLRLHCMVLAQLLSKACGNGAANKRVPVELMCGPMDFIKGLVDGYISGDGSVPHRGRYITAASASRGLLEDMRQIFARVGITCTIKENKTIVENASKQGLNAQKGWCLTIGSAGFDTFSKVFRLTLASKQARIDEKGEGRAFGRNDFIPDIVTKQWGTVTIHRSKIEEYIANAIYEEDEAVLRDVANEDIMYDKIESIEEVVSDHPYVYDLTVADTRNFNIYNGLAIADTFHSAGVSSASKTVRGVPRLEELLRISKNIKGPSVTVYLKDEINKNYDKSREVRNAMETTYIKDIIQSSSIYFNPDDTATDIDKDIDFIQMYKAYEEQEKECDREASPWLLRLEMDKGKMFDLGLTMEDVHFALYNFYEDMVHCVFSDDNAEKLVFRIRLNDTDKEDMITKLTALEQNVLENVIVKGIKGVHKAMLSKQDRMEYNRDVKMFQKGYEWVISTDGTNLRQVLAIPEVDYTRTVSNDVHEIYNILGIEATRQVLINEIMECLAGVDVGMRHIALLADVMTLKGGLLSIDRHGINRSDIGPMAKCSFEETSDMLIKAGMFAEYDPINGVSANIMLGQIPPCGTGDTIVLMDPSKLADILPTVQEEEEEGMDTDMMCMPENVRFDFKAPVAASKPHSLPDLPLIVS